MTGLEDAPLGCLSGWQAAQRGPTRLPLLVLLTRAELGEWVAHAGPCPAVWPPSLDDVAPAGCQLGDLHKCPHEHLPPGAASEFGVIRWPRVT